MNIQLNPIFLKSTRERVLNFCLHAAQIILFLLPTYAFARECDGYLPENRSYDFHEYFPSSEQYGLYYRRGRADVLYHGVDQNNPQVTVPLAIRAMLGDSSAYVGSRLHFYIVQGLVEGPQREFRADQALREINDEFSQTKSDLSKVVRCAKVMPFAVGEAQKIASDILDRLFRETSRLDKIKTVYLDQAASTYDNSPSTALFSSLYPKVAGLYGRKVLLTEDSTQRSIDMEFWEIGNRNPHEPGSHPEVDLGEFLSPGYIQPRDVSGLWVKAGDPDRANLYSRSIAVVFYKTTHHGLPAVAVLKAPESVDCIVRIPSGEFTICDDPFRFEGGFYQPVPLPSKTREAVAPLGYLSLCTEQCPTLDFGSTTGLLSEWRADLEALQIDGKKLRWSH